MVCCRTAAFELLLEMEIRVMMSPVGVKYGYVAIEVCRPMEVLCNDVQY
jgi:hypothetical protein